MEKRIWNKIRMIVAGIGLILLVALAGTSIIACYQYNNSYDNLWTLADRSSTIVAKRDYISSFVKALENGKAKGDFTDYNAIWLKTPMNNFNKNLDALKTLASRLDEIQGMDPNSFQYNTAIQQITGQEQGEAKELIHVFQGCWLLKMHPFVWEWIGMLVLLTSLSFILFGTLIGAIMSDVCDWIY
jgi:hypothetical protein